jgi:hypothetical protein
MQKLMSDHEVPKAGFLITQIVRERDDALRRA